MAYEQSGAGPNQTGGKKKGYTNKHCYQGFWCESRSTVDLWDRCIPPKGTTNCPIEVPKPKRDEYDAKSDRKNGHDDSRQIEENGAFSRDPSPEISGGPSVRDTIRKGYLENHTTNVCPERPMKLSWPAAGIMAGFQPKIKSLVMKPTTDNEHFLGIWMRFPPERFCIGSREKAGQSGILPGNRIDTQCQIFNHSFKSFDGSPLSRTFSAQGVPICLR
jgi:hypothetical protein